MSRRKSVQSRLRDAIDQRDIVEYSWAILEQARIELRNHKKLVSFSGNDLKNLINIIAAKSLTGGKHNDPVDKQMLAQLSDWLDDKEN